jgi:hypothetical protein
MQVTLETFTSHALAIGVWMQFARILHVPKGAVLAERPAGPIGLNHDDLQGIGHGAP